jgi:hypothetical protein
MGSVWYVTEDRAVIDWTSALAKFGEDYTATIDIHRLTRDDADHEVTQLWAQRDSFIDFWSAERARQEASYDPVPDPIPLPYPGPGGALTGPAQWSETATPAGDPPAADIDTFGAASTGAFHDRF